jgi:acylphosphatase
MRRRYFVDGVVQGVGFRYFARRQALRIGLVGWVRNTEDGSVEAEAEGTASQLGEFEAELRRGPAFASVTNLRAEDILDEIGGPRSFEIRG